MPGKLIAGLIVVVALIFGAAVYWVQVYAYYERLPADTPVSLVTLATGVPEALPVSGFEGIDSESSPIRYRACFRVAMSLAALTETYASYEGPTPLNGPGWFSCYDAAAIGKALEAGEAFAFLGAKNIHDGVDRVIAVFPDGRAYAWQQLNEKYRDR